MHILARWAPLAVVLAVGPARAQFHSATTLVSPAPAAGGSFGHAIAGAGDVDGDGRVDVIVGAFREGAGGSSHGNAYVFSGATGALVHALTSPSPQSSGDFGQAVAGTGDLDGDGVGELLVGAPSESAAGQSAAGRVYVFRGSSGTLLRTLQGPAPTELDYFGTSVANVGDINGDGVADMVVGAAAAGENGRAWIFSGSDGAILRPLVTEGVFPLFGWSAAGLGDVDGDAVPDMAVGAPHNNGRAYIHSGATGQLLHTLASPEQPTHGLGRFGWQVAGPGDVDGDGRGDVMVGAAGDGPYTGGPPLAAGRAYIFSGATGALLSTLTSPSEQVPGRFGISVAGAGDITGDGRPDVVVGAHYESPTAALTRAGRAHVFDGATGLPIHTLMSPDAQSQGNFGWAVAGPGDMNGDGRPDVAVAANMEDPPPGVANAGRAYLLTDLATAEAPTPTRGEAGLRVRPNPSHGPFAATVLVNEVGRYRLSVFDVTGREVLAALDGDLGPGEYEITLGADLPSGIYLVRLYGPRGASATRPIVRR